VDADVLKENEQLRAEINALRSRTEYQDRILRLQERKIEDLTRRLYGRRSERLNDPDQLSLPLELAEEAQREIKEEEKTLEEAVEVVEETIKSRKVRRGRRPLPKDLPRKRVVLELSGEDTVCCLCRGEMKKIGEDVTETLEYVPAIFQVIETVRPKFACPKCQEGVVTAPLPPRPIEKGRPGPGLLTQVVVSKYGDHLPLYRQEQIYERQGIELPRSTLCGWVASVAELVSPVVDEMKRGLLQGKLLQSDDTRVMVQLEERPRRVEQAYLWAYCVPWGEVVYDFTLSRSRDGPNEFLTGFKGYLQTDAYGGYNEVFRRPEVIRVGCLAHVRRKFFEAREECNGFPLLALSAIQRLYRIEREAKERGLSPEERRELRREESLPLLESLRGVLEDRRMLVLPKSQFGMAISYALEQWEALTRYVEVLEAEIDNNSVEHAMRVVALGRKNWLQVGSEAGGRRAAILYSLIESAKRLGLDPFAYLRDLLERLPSHSADRMAELTPSTWKRSLQR
jgi:transposase